jgi:hypothetical protein
MVKKGNVLLFVLVIVFLIALGIGGYFYLNQSGKLDFLVKKPVDTSTVGQLVQPIATPTNTIEEDLKTIEISTDEADLQELKAEINNL